MSQVGVSRPTTQQNMVGRLPEIQHPLSRMSNPENLDIRGVSRAGGERPTELHSGHGRPLPAENTYHAPHRYSMGSSRGKVSRSLPEAPMNYETIPEWAEVTQGDPRKPRMPIFGSRAEVASRADVQSRISSRLSKASSQQRLEIDELESILKEKIQNNFYELKKNFKANDPEQKGTVSREALFRILITITNKPINQGQFTRLMDRLGLKDKIAIHYSEFFALFRDVQSADYPRWIDPVQRHWQERGSLTASQVHVLLKEKAKGTRTVADLLPQVNADGSKFILKPEFRTVLGRLGFSMSDDEFEKLWAK
ncbi:hypothetical protein LSH36_6g11010 [Paralvinella palmiformis]|uniref:Uncharacterized protein n=1 Tax=Paralvinella palmiformis TaxID=53620 RepID=A0AAD9KES7_9ANNE|nr:hypothetical protein LSH36_6g11010 [Paralvinella palmiformis]